MQRRCPELLGYVAMKIREILLSNVHCFIRLFIEVRGGTRKSSFTSLKEHLSCIMKNLDQAVKGQHKNLGVDLTKDFERNIFIE